MTVDEILEGLKGLTLAEAEELVEKLIEEFPKLAEMPAAGVAMAMPAGAGADAAAEEEAAEPTEFNVVLTEVGSERVKVIKAVRELTNNALGLKEAKEAVENAPFTVLESVDKETAEAGLAKLQEAGATAEVQPV